MKIVIVGAGIGGLTLGVALRQRGHEVRILEKRAEFCDEGAGVVLGPNVLAAVRLLGLDSAIEAEGRVVPAMNIADQRGRVLARGTYRVTPLLTPGVAIHRSRLHRLLRERFDGELVLGADVSELDFGEHPRVCLPERALDCDLVVGADGIRSRVRRELEPNFETRYSGTTCFRFVVREQWTDEVFEQWGAGKRVGVVPLGHGETYVFLTLNRPRRAQKDFSSLAQFRALWSEFSGPAARALLALDELEGVLHNDLEDGLAARFCAPGVVLLGDAAHAVTPNMGQGAGLAIEDACCLASLLPDSSDAPHAARDEALADYERLRRPRADWILRQSYSLGKVAQLESAPLRWLRDWAMRVTPDSINARALRRIVSDMPGVPIAQQLPEKVGEAQPAA